MEAVQAQGLDVSGLEEMRDALAHGPGGVLRLADEASLNEQPGSDLVRLATLSGPG